MINKQQTTFPNGIIDLSPINHNPCRETKKRSSEQQKAIDIVATTPPPASKIAKDNRPPFFAFLSRSQKQAFSTNAIEEQVLATMQSFVNPELPTEYLHKLDQIKITQTNERSSKNVSAKAVMANKVITMKNELQLFIAINTSHSHP